MKGKETVVFAFLSAGLILFATIGFVIGASSGYERGVKLAVSPECETNSSVYSECETNTYSVCKKYNDAMNEQAILITRLMNKLDLCYGMKEIVSNMTRGE